jgi:uncharacterized BrkB/YihY/UPF0761 family membrane protein
MWFYISGLMLLLGAEIDAKLEEAAELESRPQTSQPKRSN